MKKNTRESFNKYIRYVGELGLDRKDIATLIAGHPYFKTDLNILINEAFGKGTQRQSPNINEQ